MEVVKRTGSLEVTLLGIHHGREEKHKDRDVCVNVGYTAQCDYCHPFKKRNMFASNSYKVIYIGQKNKVPVLRFNCGVCRVSENEVVFRMEDDFILKLIDGHFDYEKTKKMLEERHA